jgi:hypothetical protein
MPSLTGVLILSPTAGQEVLTANDQVLISKLSGIHEQLIIIIPDELQALNFQVWYYVKEYSNLSENNATLKAAQIGKEIERRLTEFAEKNSLKNVKILRWKDKTIDIDNEIKNTKDALGYTERQSSPAQSSSDDTTKKKEEAHVANLRASIDDSTNDRLIFLKAKYDEDGSPNDASNPFNEAAIQKQGQEYFIAEIALLNRLRNLFDPENMWYPRTLGKAQRHGKPNHPILEFFHTKEYSSRFIRIDVTTMAEGTLHNKLDEISTKIRDQRIILAQEIAIQNNSLFRLFARINSLQDEIEQFSQGLRQLYLAVCITSATNVANVYDKNTNSKAEATYLVMLDNMEKMIREMEKQQLVVTAIFTPSHHKRGEKSSLSSSSSYNYATKSTK